MVLIATNTPALYCLELPSGPSLPLLTKHCVFQKSLMENNIITSHLNT